MGFEIDYKALCLVRHEEIQEFNQSELLETFVLVKRLRKSKHCPSLENPEPKLEKLVSRLDSEQVSQVQDAFEATEGKNDKLKSFIKRWLSSIDTQTLLP